MSNSWAFSQLNQLTPSAGPSPTTGPSADRDRNDFSLSFPVSGSALQAQLEAWTNVTFDFDGAGDFGGVGEFHEKDDGAYGGGLGVSAASGVALGGYPGMLGGDALLGMSTGAGAVVDPFLDFYGPVAPSLVDQALLIGPSPTPTGLPTLVPTALVAPAPSLPLIASPAPSAIAATKPAKAGAKKRRQSSSAPGGAESIESPDVDVEGAAGPAAADGDDAENAVAVEEDKRRRNTAASARFRIKKKQREAALESTAKELRDRVSTLEREVEGLRTENGWLRGLIVDKAQKDEVEKKIKHEEQGVAAKRARVDNDAGDEALVLA